MEQKKKPQVWMPLLFSITLIIGMMLGYRMRDTMPGKPFFSLDKSSPLQELFSIIRTKYVDEVKLNDLSDTAINAILSKLDPHSVYINAEEVQANNDDLAGNFFGIGVEFNLIDDTINIMQVLPDGPAFKAGIQTGDKFLRVNDSVVAGVKIREEKIKKLLRGPDATVVAIDLLRGSEKKSFRFNRGMIPVSSIDAAYMIQPGTGYIRLNKFSQVTYREFMESLEQLKEKGLKQLILDLRGNGGGVLDQATEIADEFLDGDKLITYTEGKNFPKKEYRCKRPGLFETGKLVVLADEGSASASEILLGALQDWNRATIIGRRSFGKGLVQEQFDLSDGSAVRLTIARYYTPVGRSIQRPYNLGEKAYYEDIFKRYHDGEVVSADSIKNDTTLKFVTPSGKVVYGGGGITPDVFVAMDTSLGGPSVSRLYLSGTIADFAYLYYLRNQDQLKSIVSPSELGNKFSISAADWQQLNQMAAKDSIDINTLGSAEKKSLEEKLMAAMARQLWRSKGYYEFQNLTDPGVKKAIEILSR